MANGNLIEFINADIEAIKKYNNDIANAYVFIARRLYELKESGYIETTNYKEYKNIYDLSLHEFGYEKAKTNYLILIYVRFFKDFMLNHVKSKYQEYSVTQLRYMLDMTEEQINQCNSDMSVRAIKEIKLKLSTRVDNETIENTDNLKNNNVVTGIFPDKKQEEKEEEKQKTIIVSELPKTSPPIQEEKTVTTITETITTQNLDFETNPINNYVAEINDKLTNNYKSEISRLNDLSNTYQQQFKQYYDKYQDCKNLLHYTYKELFDICKSISNDKPINNDKLHKLLIDINNFTEKDFLPDKLKFMREVI